MSFYVLIVLLLGVFFSLLLYQIVKIHDTSKYWVKIIFSLILSLIFKSDLGIHFYGLEYEDAYVFNFIARQFANNIYCHSFLTDGIVAGSIENPVMMGTYGGHFITYPAFLSVFYRFWGFEPQYICHINTFIEFLSLSILSIFPIKINKTNLWFLLPVLYCIAPIMNVFSTSGFSETFSSFICLSFVFLLCIYHEKKSWYNCIFCILTLFMTFLCKRENICLLLLPYTYALWNYFKNKTFCKNDLLLSIGSSFMLIVYLACIQNVFNIEHIESKDIGSNTFSIGFFSQLFPIFVKSLFTVNYFSISIYVLVILTFYIWKQKEYWTLNFLALFGIYLLLYSLHYRGYFFVKYNEISVFDTVRYINNFYYLIPVIVASALYKLIIGYKRWIIYLSCIIVLIYSLTITFNLRKELSQIEDENRFCTTRAILQYLEKENNTVLIAENILLYQLFSDDSFTICDITKINDCESMFGEKNNFILTNDDTNDYLKERYKVFIKFPLINPIFVFSNMKLYNIKLNKSSSSVDDNFKTERRCIMSEP
jgi:hypothetical protein